MFAMASRGELERRVMTILWHADSALSVAVVHAELAEERDLAYTTVMTVLDRLAKKGLAKRELMNRAWQYKPAQPRHLHVAMRIREQLASLDLDTRQLVLEELKHELAV